MEFSYNWLQSFFKKKLPKPEKLAQILTMHSFEVKEVKKIGSDFVLNIEILPNRGSDCFSHLGIAREISALINSPFNQHPVLINQHPELGKAKDFIEVKVKNRKDCLRYTARIVFDVKVGVSPKWIRDRLRSCGLRSINNIVDIANYVMLEMGQPLHAFDFEKIAENKRGKKGDQSKKKIIVRRAKKGEKIITLDEEKYDLDSEVLVIADPQGPLAIAGIKGGKKAEIDKNTKSIVLESANFNPLIVRNSSKNIDLKTDASWRFEHGIDPSLTELAINRASFLIQEIAKGKVAPGLIDFYPQKIWPKKIELDLNLVNKLLGVDIPEKEIKNILKKLSFKITRESSFDKLVQIEVPTFRLDIDTPEDLIEEIARIYGFEKIPPLLPSGTLIPPKRNLDLFWATVVKNVLKEAGLCEVYNYSFIREKDREIFPFKNLIEVENPTSSDYKYLRPSLIPNLLKNISKNQRFFQEIRLFEIGKVFKKDRSAQKSFSKKQIPSYQGKVREKKMLTGAINGDAFFEAKGLVDLLFQKLGIASVWYDQFRPTPEETEIFLWHPKRCAEIKVDHQEIGFMGEISPKILEALKIEGRVVVFDLDFEKLSQLASEEVIYRPISPYPAAIRDISVLVRREVLVEEVLNEIERCGGELITDVDLFDIYEGEALPEGMKSLAFHIVYQAKDHPLSPEEINQIQEKIITALEEKGWEVRK